MTSELDLPLLPSAEQIRRREFATVRRGYDPDQVREYLGQVATQVETLEKGLREAKMQAETKAQTPGESLAGKMAGETITAPAAAAPAPVTTEDAYARLTARFGRMIESADKEATAVVDEAKGDASRFTAIYQEYAKAKDVTKRRMYLETLRTVFPKLGPKYIVDADQKNFLPLLNMANQSGAQK